MFIIDLIRWKLQHHSIMDLLITDAHCNFKDAYDDDSYDDYLYDEECNIND